MASISADATSYIIPEISIDDNYEVNIYAMIIDVEGNPLISDVVVKKKEAPLFSFGKNAI